MLHFHHLSNQIQSSNVLQLKKDVSTTFTHLVGVIGKSSVIRNHLNESKMSSFLGGTLGLFTGLSIISMVEAAFWVYKVNS